jgi:hypothetical protein
MGVRYVPAGTGPVVYRAPVRGYQGGAWNAHGALGGQSGSCAGGCGDSGCQGCTGCTQGCEGDGGCAHCAGGSTVMDGGHSDGQVINETWSDEQVVEGLESSIPSQPSTQSVSPQAPSAPATPSTGNPQTRKSRPTGNTVRQASSQRFSPAEQKRQRPAQPGGRSVGQPTRRP